MVVLKNLTTFSPHVLLKVVRKEHGFAQVLVILLLLAGLGVGVYLVQQKTNFLPKAFISGPISISPTPSPVPQVKGKFVLYFGSTSIDKRIILEQTYGIKWLNHAGLPAGMTVSAARAQGIIGQNYWPGYSVYEGDPRVMDGTNLTTYSQPPELVGHPERLALYFGSTDISTRQKLENRYKLTWLGHAGLPSGMTVGAARGQGYFNKTYWPGYSIYQGDKSVLKNPDLLPYARPSEVLLPPTQITVNPSPFPITPIPTTVNPSPILMTTTPIPNSGGGGGGVGGSN